MSQTEETPSSTDSLSVTLSVSPLFFRGRLEEIAIQSKAPCWPPKLLPSFGQRRQHSPSASACRIFKLRFSLRAPNESAWPMPFP